jgi:hypothetical protein
MAPARGIAMIVADSKTVREIEFMNGALPNEPHENPRDYTG